MQILEAISFKVMKLGTSLLLQTENIFHNIFSRNSMRLISNICPSIFLLYQVFHFITYIQEFTIFIKLKTDNLVKISRERNRQKFIP